MQKKKVYKGFYLGANLPGVESDVDAVNLHVKDDPESDGVYYEFSIALVQFRQGTYAMQARVFSDAWEAFSGCSEVFEILKTMHDCFREEWGQSPEPFDLLVASLEKAGWKNEGRKTSRFVRRCGECGQQVRKNVPRAAEKTR